MQDVAQFGIDWDGPMPENVTDETVEVPSIPCLLTDCDYAELCTNINPLATSSNYGIDIYLDCLDTTINTDYCKHTWLYRGI